MNEIARLNHPFYFETFPYYFSKLTTSRNAINRLPSSPTYVSLNSLSHKCTVSIVPKWYHLVIVSLRIQFIISSPYPAYRMTIRRVAIETGNWMKRLRLCPCTSPAHTSSTPRVPPSGRRNADSQACQWHPDWSNCRGSVREFPWNSRRSCWSHSRSTPCKKSSKFLIILSCPFILHHDWEQSWILSLSYYKTVLRRGQANTKNIRSDFFHYEYWIY